MKKLVFLIVLILFVFGLYVGNAFGFADKVNLYLYYSPCARPIQYKIGSVDPRFGLTKQDVEEDVQEGASVWKSAWGSYLFVEQPTAKLSLNLVYDERQSLNNQINSLQGQLNNDKNSLSAQKSQYEKDVADFEAKLNDLNNQIQKWNSQGGAPPDVYQNLINQQNQLRQEASSLNQRAKALNLSAYDFNQKVDQLNSSVNSFNQEISQKPEEGLYMGPEDRIEIYFNNSRAELVHTIAHELGHALGMDHVNDSQAIMYAYTSSFTKATNADISGLKKVCKTVAVWDSAVSNLKTTFSHTSSKNE